MAANNNPSDWYINQGIFTATTTVTTAAAGGSSAVSDQGIRLSPERGRVSKPSRRRSRASRRTPTTMLNTDTANFRAMVQQFTGGPSAMAFASPTQGFTIIPPPSSVQQLPPWQFDQYHHQQQARPPHMFTQLGNSNNPNLNLAGGGYNNTAVVPGGFGMGDETSSGPDSKNVTSS